MASRFTSKRGETFALVGESGSGKSTVARMVVGLLQPSGGLVKIDGIDMASLADADARMKLRRTHPDDLSGSGSRPLNPRWRVDRIVWPSRSGPSMSSRANRRSRTVSASCSRGRAASGRWLEYPHEFSGGQRQRVAIARALASNAEFISSARADLGARCLGAGADPQPDARPAAEIRADLSVHQPQSRGRAPHGEPHRRDVSRRLAEVSDSKEMFAAPRHPYTRMLLDAVPTLR